MDNLMLICFGIFLLALIVLDIVMIISLLKPGDERDVYKRQILSRRLYG